MNISLSIESFPLDEKTVQDASEFIALCQTDYSVVLHQSLWQNPEARGFAVVAYTDEGELLGFASSADLIGLHHYEWSVLIHSAYRRMGIGSALAEGIEHGHQQRQAESVLAAFVETPEAEGFLESIGYKPDFKEILMDAEPLGEMELPVGLLVQPYNGERAQLESLLESAFDEEVLPVISHNIDAVDREIWVMLHSEEMVATATLFDEGTDLWVTAFAVDPSRQGQGFGKAFLLWCRHHAFVNGKRRVLLDVETDNDALSVYGKAGFQAVDIVAYWKKVIEPA